MRLPPSLRRGFYATGGVVALSGIAWLYGRYAAEDALSRSWASRCMETHGGAAMVLLVLLGSTVALHSPSGWRERKNRSSGVAVSLLTAVLVLTGFLLYYLGDERARAAASLVHWLLGLAAPLLVALHVWLGRRTRAP
jgi:uncharacterized membrane protein